MSDFLDSYCHHVTIAIYNYIAHLCKLYVLLPCILYLRPSYFNDTLILAIFVSMDLAHINFSDFTKNYSLFKQ